MPCKDYYRILHLEEDANEAEIKAAYRRLARKYHPDVSAVEDAEERFKEVAEAYDTLGDPVKRMTYDCLGYYGRELPDWERQFSEFFCADSQSRRDLDGLLALFQGRETGGEERHSGGSNDNVDAIARITLEQAVRGAEIDIEIPAPLATGMSSARETTPVRVHVPCGVRHGQRVRVRGFERGHRAHGESPHDLTVRIAVRPHPLFTVEGDDLRLDVPVTPWEAALGASIEVPTLDGGVRVRIPPGVQTDQTLRLTGRGMPKPAGGAGDLYARLKIVTPPELTEREKQLFAELARASSFEPREHFPA